MRKLLRTIIRKISRTYRTLADSKLVTFAQNVFNLTSVSEDLANPTPTMAALEDAINFYIGLLGPSLNRDRQVVSDKNDAKNALIALLDELANFVTLRAKNVVSIMVASGFEVINLPSAITIYTPELKITDGPNPNSLTLIAKGAGAATSYVYRLTAGPVTESSIWITETNTTQSFTFTGLQKQVEYWGQVIAISGNNQRMESLFVSRVAQ